MRGAAINAHVTQWMAFAGLGPTQVSIALAAEKRQNEALRVQRERYLARPTS